MGETPKEKVDSRDKIEDASEEASWGEDQKNRGYYYDDAHGYTTYDPELDDDIDGDDIPSSDTVAASKNDQIL